VFEAIESLLGMATEWEHLTPFFAHSADTVARRASRISRLQSRSTNKAVMFGNCGGVVYFSTATNRRPRGAM
jgi:hypothetical protein